MTPGLPPLPRSSGYASKRPVPWSCSRCRTTGACSMPIRGPSVSNCSRVALHVGVTALRVPVHRHPGNVLLVVELSVRQPGQAIEGIAAPQPAGLHLRPVPNGHQRHLHGLRRHASAEQLLERLARVIQAPIRQRDQAQSASVGFGRDAVGLSGILQSLQRLRLGAAELERDLERRLFRRRCRGGQHARQFKHGLFDHLAGVRIANHGDFAALERELGRQVDLPRQRRQVLQPFCGGVFGNGLVGKGNAPLVSNASKAMKT